MHGLGAHMHGLPCEIPAGVVGSSRPPGHGPLCMQPQVPTGGGCDDGTACTLGDVCAADGTCSGTPTDAVCEDNIACTTNTCSPGDATADASGCTIAYDNSACADNIACTDDVCVGGRDPAALGIAAGDAFNTGCGYTNTANPDNACKYEQPPPPPFQNSACLDSAALIPQHAHGLSPGEQHAMLCEAGAWGSHIHMHVRHVLCLTPLLCAKDFDVRV